MVKLTRIARPTLETRFHVDWSWFERNHFNAEKVIRDQLTPKVAKRFPVDAPIATVDYVNPQTGEVTPLDALREAIINECQWEPRYLTGDIPLVQAVLRVFLANHNQPLTVIEIAQRLERIDPDPILRVLTSSGVQMGIVPQY
jgi:hypothetical protein